MTTRTGIVLASFVSLLLTASCGDHERQYTERRDVAPGGSDNEAPEPGPAHDQEARVAFPVASATATIRGTCVWDGPLPRGSNLKIAIAGDDFCVSCYPGGPPISEKKRIDPETKGIGYCFVQVKDAARRWTFTVPAEPAHLRQKNCRYVPHTLGMMAGQMLEVSSEDATQHNVHFIGRRNRVARPNVTQNQGARDEFELKRPELVKFKCDIHGWMNANVWVVDHRLFAVSDEKGRFTLPKLPPGDYEITAWHEQKSWKTTPVAVRVAAGETKDIRIRFLEK